MKTTSKHSVIRSSDLARQRVSKKYDLERMSWVREVMGWEASGPVEVFLSCGEFDTTAQRH